MGTPSSCQHFLQVNINPCVSHRPENGVITRLIGSLFLKSWGPDFSTVQHSWKSPDFLLPSQKAKPMSLSHCVNSEAAQEPSIEKKVPASCSIQQDTVGRFYWEHSTWQVMELLPIHRLMGTRACCISLGHPQEVPSPSGRKYLAAKYCAVQKAVPMFWKPLWFKILVTAFPLTLSIASVDLD